MNIKEYIKELLFTNQGVIIPRLGGFVSEYEPAAFDVSENKFLPPSKKITFNTEYAYQDSLLAEFIAKKEKTSKEKAEQLLKEFVNDTKYKLKKGEKIDFPEIGTLTQSSKGQISFTQSKESNLLTDSFGLKSVKTNQPVAHAIKPSIKTNNYSKKAIIIASAAVILISVIIISWYFSQEVSDFNVISSTPKTENKLIEITEKNLDSIARADSIKALIVNSIDDNTDKKDALFYQEPAKEIQKPTYSEFNIIAGSFKKMENAEKFSTKLKEKGYDPKILKSGENLIRISIYTYTNEAEALKQLYKLRETTNIKSVWILKSI